MSNNYPVEDNIPSIVDSGYIKQLDWFKVKTSELQEVV